MCVAASEVEDDREKALPEQKDPLQLGQYGIELEEKDREATKEWYRNRNTTSDFDTQFVYFGPMEYIFAAQIEEQHQALTLI